MHALVAGCADLPRMARCPGTHEHQPVPVIAGVAMTFLDDRVVIVTGASRRIAIGAAIARGLVTVGAGVLLHS